MAQAHKRRPEGPFYRDLGRNLRMTRSAAGKTQMEIADYLDVTFQQVQKYENGANRIPFDRLVNLAAYLDVPLSHFGSPDTSNGDSAIQSLVEQYSSKDFQTLLKSWTAIKDRHVRAAVLDFVKSMAALSR